MRPYVADPAPDARYAGVPVWWSPTLAQEERLPTYPGSLLPATIDLNAPVTPLTDHPIRRAVAAFAASTDRIPLEYVRVLAPDGRLLSVDTTPVRPMTDPEGHQRIRVGPSLLSRSGEYLLFPQDHSLLVYTLRTGRVADDPHRERPDLGRHVDRRTRGSRWPTRPGRWPRRRSTRSTAPTRAPATSPAWG